MNLFSKLRRLYRPDSFQFEDFHTEIVAQVLQNNPALTLSWLRGIKATSFANDVSIKISTQETFQPLPGHSTPSRPDITIRLFFGAKKELIFIESKQDSKQWGDQLKRYAEHLHAAQLREGHQNASLAFITRDYEAAENPQNQITFVRTRWFQFYQYLKAHVNGDGLAKELKLFMEENRMSLGNKFRSTDLVAMENFLSAKALMDETLEGEVSEAVKSIFGNVFAVKNSLVYFREKHRYAASNGNWTNFECHIGYWLPQDNPDEPVWVGIKFYSKASAIGRKDMIEAFRGWSGRIGCGWSADKLDDEADWSCISKGKPLQAFMSELDHVQAIKMHLLGLLSEVEVFRKTYRNLPWDTTTTLGVDEAPSAEDAAAA
jgi:hypothetical protein